MNWAVDDSDGCTFFEDLRYLRCESEHVEYISVGMCFANLNLTQEHRDRRNASIRATWSDPERRKRQSDGAKLWHRNHDPEVNAKRSTAIKKSHANPETRAKLSAIKKAWWAQNKATRHTPVAPDQSGQ